MAQAFYTGWVCRYGTPAHVLQTMAESLQQTSAICWQGLEWSISLHQCAILQPMVL